MPEMWPFSADPKTVTFVSRHIFAGDPICFAYHEWKEDAWQFLPDRVTEESDIMLVCLREVHNLDDSVSKIADLPNGWMASRIDSASPWERKRNHPFPVFEINRFYLDDAEEYERLYPDQYQIPSSEVRENLKVGDCVKLIFRFADEWAPREDNECERMWVEIAEADNENECYKGTLLNDPHQHSAITAGHELCFHPIHVFDIHDKTYG